MDRKSSCFKIILPKHSNHYRGVILLDNEPIHDIEFMSELYEMFGYKTEMAINGALPEEFVWETYFRRGNKNCADCYQMKIFDYLVKFSATFSSSYKHRLEEWLAHSAKLKEECDVEGCVTRNALPQ